MPKCLVAHVAEKMFNFFLCIIYKRIYEWSETHKVVIVGVMRRMRNSQRIFFAISMRGAPCVNLNETRHDDAPTLWAPNNSLLFCSLTLIKIHVSGRGMSRLEVRWHEKGRIAKCIFDGYTMQQYFAKLTSIKWRSWWCRQLERRLTWQGEKHCDLAYRGMACLINCCLLGTISLLIFSHRCFQPRSGIWVLRMIKMGLWNNKIFKELQSYLARWMNSFMSKS